MNNIIYFFTFCIGVSIASFINVVIYRLPLNISFINGRSFCPHCHHQLHSFDLIPIFSFLFLRGKCRYCSKTIPLRDFLLELFGGGIAMLCLHHYSISLMAFLSFVLAMVFVAISFIDFDTMEIYDSFIVFSLLVGVLINLCIKTPIVESLIGFLIISLPMYFINILFKECFGGGDIKLIAVCGMMLGYKYLIVGMIIAIFVAGIYAFSLMVRHRVKRNDYIAFGPFICIGVFTSLLYGEYFLDFYTLCYRFVQFYF